MKKMILYTFIAFSMLFLTGCDDEQHYSKEALDAIEKVEIVSAENILEYIVIKTFSEKEEEEFIEQLQDVKFSRYYGDPPGLMGDSIKITYQNGVYKMICSYTMEYMENGRRGFLLRSWDEDVFNDLFNRYSK